MHVCVTDALSLSLSLCVCVCVCACRSETTYGNLVRRRLLIRLGEEEIAESASRKVPGAAEVTAEVGMVERAGMRTLYIASID